MQKVCMSWLRKLSKENTQTYQVTLVRTSQIYWTQCCKKIHRNVQILIRSWSTPLLMKEFKNFWTNKILEMSSRIRFSITKTYSMNSELFNLRRRLLMKKLKRKLPKKLLCSKSKKKLKSKWQRWISEVTSQNMVKTQHYSMKCTWTILVSYKTVISLMCKVRAQVFLCHQLTLIWWYLKGHKASKVV